MPSITCECGFKATETDHHLTEAIMWHHAIRDHHEMLEKMTVEQLNQVIKGNDRQMGMA